MPKELSQAMKDRISAGQKDAWRDPSKRINQKKRIKTKRLLKGAASDRIESPSPLNIENARQALMDEIKKLDGQLAKFEPLVQRRDKLSSILEDLNSLRERQSL
jgi:predicted metal-dependent hydrolase